MLLGLALLLIRSPLAFAMHDDTLGNSPLLVETHVHSAFSADAVADVGVLAVTARALGYDAVFLTDHNEGSAFQIRGDTANRRVLDEDDGGWKLFQRGDLRSSTSAMESETAYRGVRAFHLALSAPSTGAVGLWARRGPLIAAGPVILSFAVLVRHLDPESGFAATVTLGGDSDVAQAIGYTTAGGEVLLDRHVTFAWTIGKQALLHQVACTVVLAAIAGVFGAAWMDAMYYGALWLALYSMASAVEIRRGYLGARSAGRTFVAIALALAAESRARGAGALVAVAVTLACSGALRRERA